MTMGVIDVGTNSIHLLLAEISPAGDFTVVGSEKEMVCIGRGGFAQHMLTDEAMERAIATLKRFVKMAQLMGATRLKAVGTSAVREAHNGGDFVNRVQAEVGLDLRVISAEQEARLIYYGVRHAVDLGREDNLVVDIGGGSAELIVANADGPKVLASLKLGGSRLAELFLRSDPPDPDEVRALRRHIDTHTERVIRSITPRTFTRCIGTSGTVCNIAVICAYRRGVLEVQRTQQLVVTRDELKDLFSDVVGMSREERLGIQGLDARRVDSITPAVALLLSVMKALEVQELHYCASALREGILVEHIATNRAHLLARATWPDPRTRSVLQLAERCGYRQNHAEQVARLALQLFDQLRSVHRLDDSHRDLLRSACILHDIGYLISHDNHHKHSYYLIRNGGLHGFSEQEIEIIANVARYHRKGKPKKSHYSYAQLMKRDRPAVGRLVTLLRLANALDRTHYAVVDGVSCQLKPGLVQVLVHTDKDAELELWTARKQAEFFEREFQLALEIALAPRGSDGESPI